MTRTGIVLSARRPELSRQATGPAMSSCFTRLVTALLAATHGVVALTLGTPTMKLPDMRGTGRLPIASLIDAWTSKLAAARNGGGWPKITTGTFA